MDVKTQVIVTDDEAGDAVLSGQGRWNIWRRSLPENAASCSSRKNFMTRQNSNTGELKTVKRTLFST